MKYNELIKRTIAMVMCVAMTVSMLPVSALAQEGGHTHDDSCYEESIVCGVEEGAVHVHDDSCSTIQKHTKCGLAETEGHTHEDACYQMEDVLICKQEETEGHSHGTGCYTDKPVLKCGEEHDHSDACYQMEPELTCGKAAKEAHAHGDGCYKAEKVLKCGKQVQPHTHEDACWEESPVLTCKKSTEPHVHTDACKKATLTCEFAEAEDGGEEDKTGEGETAALSVTLTSETETLALGKSLSVVLTISGGKAPYAVELNGEQKEAVEAGTHTYTLTPAEAGTFTAHVKVTDAKEAAKEAALSVKVKDNKDNNENNDNKENESKPDAYAQVKAKVDALPAVDAVAAMSDEEKAALVEQLIAIGDELEALLDAGAVTMEQYEALALQLMQLNEAIIGDAPATLGEEIDMEPHITGIEVTIGNNVYKPDKNGVFSGFTVTKNDQIGLVIRFGNVDVTVGDSIVYTLPKGLFKEVTPNENMSIHDPEKNVVGTASVDGNGNIVFTPSAKYIQDHHNSGTPNTATLTNNSIQVQGRLGDSLGNDPNKNDNVFEFVNTNYTLPFDYSDYYSRLELEKSDAVFNPKAKTLTYTITVKNAGEQETTNIKVTDVFYQSAAHIEKVDNRYYNNVTATAGNFVQSGSAPQAEWIVGSLPVGGSATLTYTVKLSDSYFTSGSPAVGNRANVTWGKRGSAEDYTSDTFSGVLNIAKTHANPYVADDGSTHIQYTVTVTAPETNTANMEEVTVVDKLPLQSGIAKDYKVISTTVGNAVPDVTEQTVNWTIGTMEPGHSETLVYDVVINEKYLMDGAGTYTEKRFDNTATVYSKGEEYDFAISQASIRKEWIGKSGVKQPDGSIKFNVTVNRFANGVGAFTAVKTLRDKITGSFRFDGDIVIVAKDKNGAAVGAPVTIPAAEVILSGTEDKEFELNFDTNSALSGIKGPYQYEVEYYAKPTSAVAVISNTATVGVGVGGEAQTWSHSATAAGTGGFSFSIQKSLLGGTPDNVNWQTLIKTFIPAGSTFTDGDHTVYPNASWHGNKRFNFTPAHLAGITVIDGDGNTLTRDVDYTVEGMVNEVAKDKSEIAYHGFIIHFLQDINGSADHPVTVRYSSETNPDFANAKEGDKNTFVNRSRMEIYGITSESKANYPAIYYNPLKKNVVNVDYSNATVTWEINLNGGSSIGGNGTLKELIPEGLEFVSAEITSRGPQAGNTTIGTGIVSESSEEGVAQEVSIPVFNLYKETGLSGLADNGRVIIRVVTRITDNELLSGNGAENVENNQNSTVSSHISKVFINRVRFEQPETGRVLNAAADITLENTPLAKSADINLSNRPYVFYSVRVNENSIDMLANSDVITVVDEMSENMNLALDADHRFSVTKISNGADITAQCALTITNGGHGFRLKVPDNIGLIIRYYVTISGVEGSTTDINNSVYFEGSSSNGVSSVINNFVVTNGAATTDAGGSFKLLKLDQDGNPLSGAQFRIYKVEMDTSSPSYNHTTHDGPAVMQGGSPKLVEIAGSPMTSDKDGYVTLRPNDLNDPAKTGIYAVREISAPDGYIIDNATYYYQFNEHPIFAQSSGVSPRGITVGATIQKYNTISLAELVVPVVKRLTEFEAATGGAKSNQSFTFIMSKTQGGAVKTLTGAAFQSAEVSVTGEGSVSFPALVFPTAGDYQFEIKEKELAQSQINAGFTLDEAVYTLNVTVGLGEDNSLTVTSTTLSKDGGAAAEMNTGNLPIFDNGYKLSEQVIIPVTKTVTGMSGTTANGKTFKFDIYRANASYVTEGVALSTAEVTVGSNNTGSANFAPLKFSTDKSAENVLGGTGTYYFVMRERLAGNGFQPNQTTHSLRIVVSDNGGNTGKLTTAAFLDGAAVAINADKTLASAAEWTNNYIPTPVSFSISASKTLNGTPTGGFSIEVIDNNDNHDGIVCAVPERNEKGKRIISDAFEPDGSLELDLSNMVTFTKAGVYNYIVKEIAGTQGGMTYDSSEYHVTVTVTDNGLGVLSASTAYYLNNAAVDTLSFANIYAANGTAHIIGEKHLSGRNWKEGDSFTFELTPQNGAPLRKVNTDGTTTDVNKLEAMATLNPDAPTSHPVDFGEIQFTNADLDGATEKVFEYKIHETGTYAGITNAKDRIVRIKVSDVKHNGVLDISYAGYDENGNPTENFLQTIDAPDLINIYSTGTVKATIKATKSILDKDGNELEDWKCDHGQGHEHDWSANEFYFQLERTREATPMPAGTDGNIAVAKVSQKTAEWGAIKFDKPGEYDYIIRELTDESGTRKPVTETNARYENQKLLYEVAVHSAKVIVTDNLNGTLSADVVYYRGNASDGNSTIPIFKNRELPDTYVNLHVEKQLTGMALRNGEFSFELYESNVNGTVADGAAPIKNASVVVTDSDANKGLVEFGALTYQWSSFPDGAGLPHDYYYVIRETGRTGVTNTTGDIRAKVTVSEGEGDKLQTAVEYAAKVNGTWTTVTSPVMENVYTSSGTAQLTVSKHIVGRDFWNDGESFTFTLTPAAGSNAPLRVMEGTELKTVASLSATATAAEKIVSFDQLQFIQSDMNDQTTIEYTYIIHEERPNGYSDTDGINGMTYAADVTVKIRLTDDGKGHITAEYQLGNREFTNVAMNAQFDNVYTLSSTVAVLKATKRLTGRQWLDTDTFTFEVIPIGNTAGYTVAAQPMPTPATVNVTNQSTATAAADSFTASFGAITYTKPGVYAYDIREDIPGERIPGVTYSTAEHRVIVGVVDNGDGTMTAKPVYTATNDPAVPPTFTNTYTPEETSLAIVGRKTLQGRELIARQYNFSLYNTDESFAVASGTAPVFTGAANANGSIDQYTLTFTQPGTYYYVLRENIPAGATVVDGKTVKDGITFDTHDSKITVTVVDNLDGTMTASAVYNNASASADADKTVTDKAAFTNVYKATGSLQMQVTKQITSQLGWDYVPEFGFRLTPGENAPFNIKDVNGELFRPDENALTATATKNYVVASFDTLWFSEEDIGKVYQYTIEEILPDGINQNNYVHNSITYNHEKIVVLVRVDDSGTGSLVVSVSYNGQDSATILNRFERVEVAGTKTWVDTEASKTHNNAQEIQLKLSRISAKAGSAAEQLVNAVPVWTDDTYVFHDLAKYDAEGYEYTYLIEETRVPGYYEGVVNGYDISNTEYTASGSIILTAEKHLNGGRQTGIQAGEFTFAVMDAEGKTVSIGKTAEGGAINFTPINYTQADVGHTYTYTVAEVAGTDKSITYSKETYKVTVAVAAVTYDSTSANAHKLNITVTKTDSENEPVEKLTFTNVFGSGSLKISKTVTGNRSSRTQEFSFKVVFDAPGSYPMTGDVTGYISSGDTVKLKHGQSVVISGLPAGAEYKVTEYGSFGYRVSATGDTGTIKSSTVSVAAFVNSRSSVPATGDNIFGWFAAMGVSLLGMALLMLPTKRRRNRV